MFRKYPELIGTNHTTLDTNTNSVITINANEYPYSSRDIVVLLKHFDNVIYEPTIEGFKRHNPSIGIGHRDGINFDVVLCNLTLWHDFIHYDIDNIRLEAQRVPHLIKELDSLRSLHGASYGLVAKHKKTLATYQTVVDENTKLKQALSLVKSDDSEMKRGYDELYQKYCELVEKSQDRFDIDREKANLRRERDDISRESLELARKQAEFIKQGHNPAIAAKLASDNKRLLEYQDTLVSELKQALNRVAELESMLGDSEADIRLVLAAAKDGGVSLRYLETTNVGGVDIYRFGINSIGCTESKLKAIAETLPGLITWLDTVPTVRLSRGVVEFRIDTRSVMDKVDNNHDDRWLHSIAASEENLAIFAPKGSGKTELAINYIGLILRQVQDCEIIFIQPKPDETSLLDLGDRVIKPDYIGLSDSYLGIQNLVETYLNRNFEKETAMKAGTKIPSHKPIFYIIDEFQTIVRHAESEGLKAKDISDSVKNAVSLGRSLNINVLIIGQNANVSNYPGWTKADYTQFNTIYLGDAIAVGSQYSQSNSEKSSIDNQWTLLKKSPIKYYGLVRKTGRDGQIVKLPEPRTYLPRVNEETHNYQALTGFTENDNDLLNQVLEAKEQGMSKSKIIQDILGYKGRNYSEGKIIYDRLILEKTG